MKNLVGHTLMNRFRVDAFIAAGGMGVVYKAWDLQRNVYLAMKVLNVELADDPSVLKYFQREARALEKLAHPHIVPFYGLYQVEGQTFLLEGYVDGLTLKSRMEQSGKKPLPPDEALAVLKAVSAALGYAHTNGVVHCDIKPGNVMIDRGGNIYLADFGIARHADSATTTLANIGTAAYMAPEQIRGQIVRPETDVYALGVMAYELFTGRRPFRGDDSSSDSEAGSRAERIRSQHLMENPPDPRSMNPRLPAELAGVLLKALPKDPEERYASAPAFFQAVCTALNRTPDGVPERVSTEVLPRIGMSARTAGGSAPTPPINDHPSSRRWLPLAALFGFILLVLFVSFGFLLPGSPWGGGSRTPLVTVITVKITATPPKASPTPTKTRRPSATSTRKPTAAPTRRLLPTSSPLPVIPPRAVNPLHPYDLAFSSNKSGKFEVYLMDSENPQDWIKLSNPSEYEKAWFPSFCNDRIAVEAIDRQMSLPYWIYLVDPFTDTASVYTPPGSKAVQLLSPSCSPDGKWMAFSSNKKDTWMLMIGDLERDKKLLQLEDKSLRMMGNATWNGLQNMIMWMGTSEDWRTFVIRSTDDFGSEKSHTIDVKAGKYPALSPDGRTLAYICGASLDLCVIDLQTGQTLFTQDLENQDVDGQHVPATMAWSGDGKWLYFSSSYWGSWDVFRIRKDGSGLQNLTEDWPSHEFTPAVTHLKRAK